MSSEKKDFRTKLKKWVKYEQEIKKCEHLKNNCKRGPRYALYPNNTSNNLVLQKFSCEWNEEDKKCIEDRFFNTKLTPK